MVSPSRLPRFVIRGIQKAPLRFVGDLSTTRYGSETWIQNGWNGDLLVAGRLIGGRWSEGKGYWVFSPDDPTAAEALAEGREYRVLDGYWAERAELVLKESLNWRESMWSGPTRHEHCGICWATIGLNENARHFAAAADGRVYRVCANCYTLNVQTRSLDFSHLGGPAA